MSLPLISCVIPAKKAEDALDLVHSINLQSYPEEKIEILIITEGDSEEAKSIGIKRAKGEILCMMCCDNFLVDQYAFKEAAEAFEDKEITGFYSSHYYYDENDCSLNRYFTLIGINDPLHWFLGLGDRSEYPRKPLLRKKAFFEYDMPSMGDNGFFWRAEHIKQANLDNYYPMDCAVDLQKKGFFTYMITPLNYVWHGTTDNNLIKYLVKRFKYVDKLYFQRKDRRWDAGKDKFKIALFVLYSFSILPWIYSFKKNKEFKDRAWFWHPICCMAFTITYGALCIYRSLFRR